MKPYLWTGPAGTLSVLHFDRAHNLFAQLYGQKKWILFPPEDAKYLYWPSPNLRREMMQFSPVDAERPAMARFPLFAKATPIEIILKPGELLFLPAAWWHQVRSLTPSISLNFFWFRPIQTLVALRSYLYHYTRRTLREAYASRAIREEHGGQPHHAFSPPRE